MPGAGPPPLPLRHGAAEGSPVLRAFGVAFLGFAYISISAGLISFNKYLIDKDRFPFATPLVWFHTIFCSVFSVALYLCCPSLYPSLTDPDRKVQVDRWLFLTGALPIAVFFSVQLILSNTAYLHCSVAFLQMLKEANIIIVYVFSLFLVLEHFSWRNVSILAFLLLATTMTVHGELRFSWVGFVIQLTGQVFESAKIVLQSKLLSSVGRKLDALTYVLLVMPCCLVFVGATMGALYIMPTEHFQVPAWRDLQAWWPYLLANAAIAFCLNVVIALFVKYSSAMAFVFAGIIKDVCIVTASWVIFQEVISPIQAFGFLLQLAAISLWTAMKMYPDRFESGIMSGMAKLVCPKFCAKDQDTVLAPFGATAAPSYGGGGNAGTVGGTAGASAARRTGSALRESAPEG